MADNLKDIGKGDRIRVSMQKHEVRHIADKLKSRAKRRQGR